MPPTSFSPDYFYFSLSARCWLAYSDGERKDRRRKGNKTKTNKQKKKEPKHPFHHSRDNLTVTLRAIPRRRKREQFLTKVPPPLKSSFPKKGTPKSKLKHLNKKGYVHAL